MSTPRAYPTFELVQAAPETAWQVDTRTADQSLLALWYRLRDEWLGAASSAATRRTYATATSQWLDWLANQNQGLHPWQVTAAHVRDWQRWLSASGKSDSTVNARLSACSSWYSFVINEVHLVNGVERSAFFDARGNTRANPFRVGNVSRAKVSQYNKANPLSAAQLSTLFDWIMARQNSLLGSRNFALLLTYFLTASRANEIVCLRWGDIRPSRTQPGAHVFQWRGKGDKEETTVFPARCYHAIIHHLKLAGRWLPGHEDDIADDEFIFRPLVTRGEANLRRGKKKSAPPEERHISAKNAQRIFASSLRRAGIDGRYRIHDLRHSFAHLHYEKHRDLEALRRLLHHESVATTGIYIRELTDPVDTHSEGIFQTLGL